LNIPKSFTQYLFQSDLRTGMDIQGWWPLCLQHNFSFLKLHLGKFQLSSARMERESVCRAKQRLRGKRGTGTFNFEIQVNTWYYHTVSSRVPQPSLIYIHWSSISIIQGCESSVAGGNTLLCLCNGTSSAKTMGARTLLEGHIKFKVMARKSFQTSFFKYRWSHNYDIQAWADRAINSIRKEIIGKIRIHLQESFYMPLWKYFLFWLGS